MTLRHGQYTPRLHQPSLRRPGGGERGTQLGRASGPWGESPPLCGVAHLFLREPVSSPRRREKEEVPMSPHTDLRAHARRRRPLRRLFAGRALALAGVASIAAFPALAGGATGGSGP